MKARGSRFSGGDHINEDGVDLPDLDTARQVATAMIRSAIAYLHRDGLPIVDHTLRIRDEAGRVLVSISFRDVMLQS